MDLEALLNRPTRPRGPKRKPALNVGCKPAAAASATRRCKRPAAAAPPAAMDPPKDSDVEVVEWLGSN